MSSDQYDNYQGQFPTSNQQRKTYSKPIPVDFNNDLSHMGSAFNNSNNSNILNSNPNSFMYQHSSTNSLNPNINTENQNIVVKDYCAKHHQKLLRIKNPDFTHSCSKCLRDVFFKRDQDQIKRQVQGDIEEMKLYFNRIKEEFGIRKNIKEEFCQFTATKIKSFMRECDLKYEQIKKRIEEKINSKLIAEMNQIESFSDEFNSLQSLIENHSITSNRSLFQVFQDNLCITGTIEIHKNNMFTLDSPKAIKTRFSEFLAFMEKKSKKRLDAYFSEVFKLNELGEIQRATRGRPKAKNKTQIPYIPPKTNDELSNKLNHDVKPISKKNYRNSVEQDSSDEIEPDDEDQTNNSNINQQSSEFQSNLNEQNNNLKNESILQNQNEQEPEFSEYFTYGDNTQLQQTQKQNQSQIQTQNLLSNQIKNSKKSKKQLLQNEDEDNDYLSYNTQTQRTVNGTQSITLEQLMNPEDKNTKQRGRKRLHQDAFDDKNDNDSKSKNQDKNKKSLFSKYFNDNAASQYKGPNHLSSQNNEAGESIGDLLMQETFRQNNLENNDENINSYSLKQALSSQEKLEKQKLANHLLMEANNNQFFVSVQENQSELEDAMQYLRDPNVLMIDPQENKMSKEQQIFHFFDVSKKVILHSLNLQLNGKNYLQVVNCSDRIFLIERQVNATKFQKLIIYEYERANGKFQMIFEEVDTKKIKPVCFQHKTRIYILMVGSKSIAYDYIDQNKLTFVSLNFQVSNSNDLKTIVMNERDLFLFHCSKSRSQGEIFHIDLMTHQQWRRIEVRTDSRPKDLIQFGILPFRRPGDAKYIALLFGGGYNTLRCTFLFDEFKKDISRCPSICTGDIDKILTNQMHIGEDEIIAFGVSRIHLFDRKTQTFRAMCYDFSYEDSGLMNSQDSVNDTQSQLNQKLKSQQIQTQLIGGAQLNDEEMSQYRDVDMMAIRNNENGESQFISQSSAMPTQIQSLLLSNKDDTVDMSICSNIDDLCN
ncbi:hypothetical protein OXYTRIMIC_320 [Oxytricha trifallax]|uniref:Uncharacterized protein n=1 Tax=Oxytricha trifallax TaxID=1172189 RepID=A0A073HZD2_9SPIT|nr:hypothetical protein OXYTRIMIC_320 [Oxytricha trifallax]